MFELRLFFLENWQYRVTRGRLLSNIAPFMNASIKIS